MKMLGACLMAAVLIAGCGKAKPAPPAPAVPAPPAPADPAPAAGWRPTLEGAAVPDTEARGQVLGGEFACDNGYLEDGVLHLRQGKDFFPDREVVVFLFLKAPGEIPQNREWTVKPSAQFDQPHIHISSKQGKDLPETEMFMNSYSMILRFGAFQDGAISGALWLCAPDEKKSWVAGTFRVRVKGFIMTPTGPDRRQDSLVLLKWLAKERMEKDNPGKKVVEVESRDTQCGVSEDPKQVLDGQAMLKMQVGDAPAAWHRFLFKRDGDWRVSRILVPSHFPEAHPESAPKPLTPEDAERLTAVAIEAELGGATVFGPGVHASGSAKFQLVTASYSLSEDWSAGNVSRKFLYRAKDGTWVLERELKDGETFDYKTETIKSK